jgi:hypothetical protein
MIRKKPAAHLMWGAHRFSLTTNAERVCAEIVLKQKLERDDDSKKSHPALMKASQGPPRTMPLSQILHESRAFAIQVGGVTSKR